jgi:hypothetical protein
MKKQKRKELKKKNRLLLTPKLLKKRKNLEISGKEN